MIRHLLPDCSKVHITGTFDVTCDLPHQKVAYIVLAAFDCWNGLSISATLPVSYMRKKYTTNFPYPLSYESFKTRI